MLDFYSHLYHKSGFLGFFLGLKWSAFLFPNGITLRRFMI